MTVIQFFQFTSSGRWPTQAELRNMSYMAIANGANGLMYWSLGAGGLAYICDGSTDYYGSGLPVGALGNRYSYQLWVPESIKQPGVGDQQRFVAPWIGHGWGG